MRSSSNLPASIFEEIGSYVMSRLRELDQVAYVRFASVYRKFEDIDAFMHELKDLLRQRSPKEAQ